MTHDPVTLTVIESALAAAADEMFAILRKTAMSPIIYEVLDCGTGITDAQGRLVSSGAASPPSSAHSTRPSPTSSPATATHPRRRPLLTNDPHDGGVTHLNDMVVALPIFHDGRLAAWAASMAHYSDIGGRTPGSWPSTPPRSGPKACASRDPPFRRRPNDHPGPRHPHRQLPPARTPPRRPLGAGRRRPPRRNPHHRHPRPPWSRHLRRRPFHGLRPRRSPRPRRSRRVSRKVAHTIRAPQDDGPTGRPPSQLRPPR